MHRGGVLPSAVLASFVAAQRVSLPHVRRGVTGGGLLSRFVRGAASAGALHCRSLLGSRGACRLRSSGRSRANPAVKGTLHDEAAQRPLLLRWAS